MRQYLLPLILSTLAGLATVLGGFVTFFIKRDSAKVLSFGLGLAAGAMLLISLFDFLPNAKEYVGVSFGEKFSWIALVAFMSGILIAIVIDFFLPDHPPPQYSESGKLTPLTHKDAHPDGHPGGHLNGPHMRRAGIFTALAVTIHNFPEGLATFFTSATDLKLGIAVVLAIAMHNIPEGIAIAIPIYQSTGSKLKAIWYTFISGMAEPIGGVVGFLLINAVFKESALGLMFGAIAGIMTYVALDTLLPLSREYDTAHYSMAGVALGMLLVGITLFVI